MNKSMGVCGGIVLLLLALLVAGCGSSSEEPLTKSEFLKQGNAICAQAAKEREKALVELIESADPKASQDVMRQKAADRIVPFYEQATEDIADLAAPKGDEAQVEAIVKDMEEAAARIKADPQSAATGGLPLRKANEAAKSYGLEDCVA